MALAQILHRFFTISNEISTGNTESDKELIVALVNKSGTELNVLRRCVDIYNAAQESKSATRSGLIGVGLITYAEHRVERFLHRIERKFNLPGLAKTFLETK